MADSSGPPPAAISEGSSVGGTSSDVLRPTGPEGLDSVVENPGSTSNTSSAPMPITYPPMMRPFRLPPPRSTHKDLRYKHKIRVFHPYYPPAEAHDPMLQFMATDGGAQYLMVYYACCIVANNCMKEDEGRVLTNKEGPFLSTSPSVEDRITVPANDILEPGNYYFIVPSVSVAPEAPSSPGAPSSRSSSPPCLNRGLHYPIIPTFDDWQPPENIPQPWQDVEVPVDPNAESPASSLEDQPCYISNHKNGIELAHIIPVQEASWAKRNFVADVLDSDKDVLDDWKNKIPLRKDLHFLWDHGYWTFFPKSTSGTTAKTYQLCIHVTRFHKDYPKGCETVEKYQNTIINNLYGVPAQVLFIRFAWSIFNEYVMLLFRTYSQYSVRVLVRNSYGATDVAYKTWPNSQIYRRVSGSSRLYSPRFERNNSSNKRKRGQGKEDVEYAPPYIIEEDENLLASDAELGWYLSPTDPSAFGSTDDDASDAPSDYRYAYAPYDSDDLDCDIDASFSDHDGVRAQTDRGDTLDGHPPRKRQRSPPSKVDIEDFRRATLPQEIERDDGPSHHPPRERTPELSKSVETVKTDSDSVREAKSRLPLAKGPLLPINHNKSHDSTRPSEKG